MAITIETITSTVELASIADQWNRLADDFKTPLLRYEWFRASAEAFCPPGKLNIAIARSDSEIVAIAPLVVNPSFGIKRLELLGTSVLGEPSGFLYKNKESLLHLLNYCLSLKKPVFFRGLPSNSLELESLKLASNHNIKHPKTDSFASPWIPIETTWDQYYTRISAHWRSTFRRMEKRAKNIGEIKYEIITPKLEDLEALLSEVFRIEMASWKARLGTAIHIYPQLRKFCSLHSHAAAQQGMLRIAFLKLGDKAVACQLFVEYANRLWILKIGYDEAYAHCSPGILLMNEVIRHAFEKQMESFEMLGTNQSWLNVWPNKIHEYYNYRLYPTSPATIFSQNLEYFNRAFWKVRTAMAKKQKRIKIFVSNSASKNIQKNF